jgi:hypothetical protein
MSYNCRYCRSAVELKTSKEHYGVDYGNNVYVCTGCGAYVGTYGRSTKPLGSLADEGLRAARKRAHSIFDLAWQRGHMTRSEAYKWLRQELELPAEKCHIGMFEEDLCEKVWNLGIQFYLTCSSIEECPDCQASGDVGYAMRMWDHDTCSRCRGTGYIRRGDM